MTQEPSLSATEFGSAFKGFLEQAVHAGGDEPVFAEMIRTHFSAPPEQLPIVSTDFALVEQVNVQIAIDTYVGAPDRTAELIGIGSVQMGFKRPRLAELIAPGRGGMLGGEAPRVGPVEYARVDLGDDSAVSCVQQGLYLIRDGDRRLALVVGGPIGHGLSEGVSVDVMAVDRSGGEQVLAELRTLVRDHNVYRGRTVGLTASGPEDSTVNARIESLPVLTAADVVLPASTMERIERHTLGVSRTRDRLAAAGRHLKRGLLLYGPPGTGKTLTAAFLAGRTSDRTTIMVNGRTRKLIRYACTMAGLLQPAMVVLEDVDMVAAERTSGDTSTTLLLELLHAMDAMDDAADVIFLLTTNRADLLEPALAARPGRIDQAVELALPDASCRRRLLELYGKGLRIRLADMDAVVARTDGVSAAFIKELLRRAAVLAADAELAGRSPRPADAAESIGAPEAAGEAQPDIEPADGMLTVTDRELSDALHDMVIEGGSLARSLLGATHVRGAG